MQLRELVAGGIIVLCTFGKASGDSQTVAAINAVGLKRSDGVVLTGAGVNIGEVDLARAAVSGFDSAIYSHPSIIPIESRNSAGHNPAAPDDGVSNDGDEHALEVAGIMIGGAGAPTSVAPGASLYSAGILYDVSSIDSGLETTQYIAKRYGITQGQRAL